MPKKKNSIVEQLTEYLKSNLSEKRYRHVTAVAETAESVLARYKCTNYLPTWEGVRAGVFCGLAHDISRELSPQDWIDCCKKHNVRIPKEAKDFPVILHGYVSAIMVSEMFENVPESWLKAIKVHTMGCGNMDDLALAIYIADYIEPNRTFLTDSQRKKYLDCPTIQLCAYSILCDIIRHLQEKGTPVSKENLEMKAYLERI